MSKHVAFAELVDYFSGDLEPSLENDVEAHLMGCDACTAEGARVSAITQGLRLLLPPLSTETGLAAMRRRGLRVEENPMRPGEESDPVLGPHLDVLVHRLSGVDPNATSAVFAMKVVETGEVLVQMDEVPIAKTGDVLLVCSPHYASLPPNVVASVTTRSAAGTEMTSEYVIRHHFI